MMTALNFETDFMLLGSQGGIENIQLFLDEFCIRLTSGPSNCDSVTWYGSPITLYHNNVEIETIPTRFQDFSHCFNINEIDAVNDTFELLSGGIDGVSKAERIQTRYIYDMKLNFHESDRVVESKHRFKMR